MKQLQRFWIVSFLGLLLAFPKAARAATALDETISLGFPPVAIRHYTFSAQDGAEATVSFEREGLVFGAVFLNGELIARPADFLGSTAFSVPVTLESDNDLVAVLAGRRNATLHITAETEEEGVLATGLVTVAAGGTIEVTNPVSPYFGAAIIVPPGGVSEDTVLTLKSNPDGIFEEFSPESVQFSPTLEIEPSGLVFNIPAEVRLPAQVPDFGPDVSTVTFGITRLGGPGGTLEAAFLVDSDFSDGLGSVLAFHLSAFAVGGYMVDSAASQVSIVTPAASGGYHTVSSNSTADPILITVNVWGRDAGNNLVDLDAPIQNNVLSGPFGGPQFTPAVVYLRFNNTDAGIVRDYNNDAAGQLVFVTDHFEINTTAGIFDPAQMPGDPITIQGIVQTAGAPQFGNCTQTTPLCAPISGLPAAAFRARPHFIFTPVSPLDFGTVQFTDNPVLNVVITNTSGVSVTMTGTTFSPSIPDFQTAVISAPAGFPPTLAHNASATVQVTLIPSAAGIRTTTITLDLLGGGVTGQSAYTFVANVLAPPPPVIDSFTANPPAIYVGNSSLLSWSATGATSCDIDNGVGTFLGNSGSASVSPAADTTYTLTCSNAGGFDTAQTTVQVNPCPVERVSVSSAPANTEGNARSAIPVVLSGGGRFVAFASEASNLDPSVSDLNGTWDAFRRDRLTGETILVSVSSQIPGQSADGVSGTSGTGRLNLSITDDGCEVAFYSEATDLLTSSSTTSIGNIFVRNVCLGTTELISSNPSTGAEGNGRSRSSVMTPDGRYVVFDSLATNLLSTPANGQQHIFLYDRTLNTMQMVDVQDGTDGGAGRIEASCGASRPNLSDDGSLITFFSCANGLTPSQSDPGNIDIFVRNHATNGTLLVTEGANADSYAPFISGDGQVVAFESLANNIADSGPADTNGGSDIYVYDLSSGLTTRVSLATGGIEGAGDPTNPLLYFTIPYTSWDGRFVVWQSLDNALVSGDTNNQVDAFIHDRQTGQTARVNVSAGGAQVTGSPDPLRATNVAAISADGTRIAFDSDGPALVSGDTNGVYDVFAVNNPFLACVP
ncbi:MAG: hypothetical protein AB1405_13565 [Bdellovibrionota bacterium]